jgi:SPP1 gp7 family putative phage head morphogenesis protein
VIRPVPPNAGVEAWYRRKLDDGVKEMHKSLMYWISAHYRASGALAMDASPAINMRNAMKKLSARWQKNFDDIAQQLASRFGEQVMQNADVSLSNALEKAGFTVPFKMTAELNNALQASIAENVNLIRSIPEQHLTQVRTLVMQSVARGRDLSQLTDDLQERYGITRRRAAFIALDQNNKATAVMQAARQESIGIDEGIWRHSHAGKHPRKSHVKANGKRFKLRKGMLIDGEYIFPGQKPRCRCGWEIVTPSSWRSAKTSK